MIRLIDEFYDILKNENLEEKYKDIFEILDYMKLSRYYDEESNKLNKKINEYLQNNKEEK